MSKGTVATNEHGIESHAAIVYSEWIKSGNALISVNSQLVPTLILHFSAVQHAGANLLINQK